MTTTSDMTSEKNSQSISQSPREAARPGREAAPLPVVATTLSETEILGRLEAAAKRGKLPGFERGGGGLFRVDAFGTPFDHDLVGESQGKQDQALGFRLRLRLAMPALLAVALVLSVEPGRYFLDALIPGEWGWIDTRWWYYPLTILPIPFVWRTAMRRSRESSDRHSREQIEKIAGFLGGTVEETTSAPTA